MAPFTSSTQALKRRQRFLFRRAAAVAAEKGEVAGSPLGCDDKTQPAIGYVESDTRQWWFNQATAPADIGGVPASYQVQDGNYNLTHGWTNCPGYSGFVNIPSTYKGNTAKKAEMDANGNCDSFTGRDGANVTDFGDLPSSKVGQACTWYFGIINEITETDIRLNKVEIKWTTAGLSLQCSGRYDIESVVTHEVGHAYGMGHVSETGHANMTMSTNSNGPCRASEATLAAGTLLALSVYY